MVGQKESGVEREREREEERVNEKVKPAVWKCFVFTTLQRRMLITLVQVWPQSNAQFAFTGILEMFSQGQFLKGVELVEGGVGLG